MGCTSSAEQAKTSGGQAKSEFDVDDYETQKTLGVGASCEVVVGKKQSNGKLYAVKVLKRSAKADENEFLFRNEVAVMKKLKHPNIVEYVASFETDRAFKLVTVLCLGGELFDRVSEGSFSERQASALTRQMLAAVSHCHERKIVHRDLKPENFVFETKAADSNMKLIDFGCAVLAEDDELIKDVAGSPYYVAPEVLASDYKRTGRVWKASDLWSIGVIVFLLVHGYPPFNGEQQDQIFHKIRIGKYRFGKNKQGEYLCSEKVRDFISKLLIMEPSKRMSAAEALKHPWIADAPSTPINPAVVQSLKGFRDQCRLKKAVAKVLAGRMAQTDASELEKVFKQFDVNGDGRLDATEIAAMMKHIGKNPAEAKDFIAQIDDDGDGFIDQKEFNAMHAMGKLSTPEEIKKAFAMFDLNGDGVVTADEIQQMCKCLSKDVADQLIRDLDKNGDGQINFNEWLQAMQNRKGK